MTTHTPGPWTLERNRATSLSVYGSDKVFVGEVYNEIDEPLQTEEANARLIAAAPELLEALKLAQSWMITEPNNDEDDTEHTRVVELVHETIAKAEGRHP